MAAAGNGNGVSPWLMVLPPSHLIEMRDDDRRQRCRRLRSGRSRWSASATVFRQLGNNARALAIAQKRRHSPAVRGIAVYGKGTSKLSPLLLAAGDLMKRRDFLTVLAVATAWASRARAQEPRRVIGVLGGYTRSSTIPGALPAFLQGLKETGFVEGMNVTIESRLADGHYDRLGNCPSNGRFLWPHKRESDSVVG